MSFKDNAQIPDGDFLVASKDFFKQLQAIDQYKSGPVTSTSDNKTYTFKRSGDYLMGDPATSNTATTQLYTSDFSSRNTGHSEHTIFHNGKTLPTNT